MELFYAILASALFASGIYLILRRNIVKLIIGMLLLSQSANLFIFLAGGLTQASPPLIEEGQKALVSPYADPLPQALILTAIVISFGVLAFFLVLLKRVYQTVQTDDLDEMRGTDI
jgi:multicomponent Na+:H+ antiporter subunit C